MGLVARLNFFIGKGGVGKTTISSAFAMFAAGQRRRSSVLLMSTDPAHSLADIFEVRFRDKHRIELPQASAVDLWQIDAKREFEKFMGRHREALLSAIEAGTIFTRAEIEPLLETTIPGLAEVAALLALAQLQESGSYDSVVIDTAPMGHTLRLFQLPEQFSRLLQFVETAASRDRLLAQHFGGGDTTSPAFLGEWQGALASVHEALGEDRARVVLVTTPEKFALEESFRAADQLSGESPGLRISKVVLNRAVLRPSRCPRCSRQAQRTREAARLLQRHFPSAALKFAGDSGSPILGTSALLAFGEHIFAGKPFPGGAPPASVYNLPFERQAWPVLETPLSLTVGKGGVGKTTISAALAFSTRKAKRAVTICSTDPAPSLDDVFHQGVGDEPKPVLRDPQFLAMEMEAARHFRAWVERIKARLDSAFSGEAGGVHLDLSFERAIFAALLDIVPPGIDEVVAVFRILDLLGRSSRHVLIDMAPTGHALELLRMPDRVLLWSRLLLKTLAPHRRLALAREAGVEIAEIGQRVRQLSKLLRDKAGARIYPVMLAEPLPDRETGRLLTVLSDLHVPVAPLFVNRFLVEENVGRCRRCALARNWQLATLVRLRHRQSAFLLAGERPLEIAGAGALKSFTRDLWQVA